MKPLRIVKQLLKLKIRDVVSAFAVHVFKEIVGDILAAIAGMENTQPPSSTPLTIALARMSGHTLT